MARSFRELGKESTELIEQGKELESRVQQCKVQIQSAAAAVASARQNLEHASQVDEEGNSVGDVSEASARLSVAQNQLAASQRALQRAQQEVERNNQQKRLQIQQIEQHNKTSRANISRLAALSELSFSENADEVQQGLIERYNEIEQARVALLESMGEKVSSETIQAPALGRANSSWSGVGFGSLDIQGEPESYSKGTSQSGSTTSTAAVSPVGGNQAMNSVQDDNSNSSEDKQNEINSGASLHDSASSDRINQIIQTPQSSHDIVNNYINALNDEQNTSKSRADRINELKALKLTLLQTLSQQHSANEENQKILTLNRKTLSPDRLYRIGINYLNEAKEIWRENLHNRGIDDGVAMNKVINMLYSQHVQALSHDIENGDFSMYDIPIDFDGLANRIALDPDYKRNVGENTHYIYSDEDRQLFRTKILNGELSEADIRDKGAKVHQMMESYSKIWSSEFQRIDSYERDLLTQLVNAKTPEQRDILEAKRKLLSDEKNRLYDRYGKEQKEVLKNVLERFRPVGPVNNSKQSFHSNYQPNDSKVIKAINTVRNYFPSAWVEEGNSRTINVAFEDRGYYSSDENKIALSGKRSMEACAFHEMSHRLEDMYPEIVEAERQFYNRRTKGKELQWLGGSYDKKEVFRDGQFIHNYMGKDYGGKAYELLSMGMESVFCGTFDLNKDPEYRDLIYGILTML